MENPQLVSDDLRSQLQCVFNACDSDSSGYIRLRDLADLSRSHVGTGSVDQVLQILGPGNNDPIDFETFIERVVTIMNSTEAVNINDQDDVGESPINCVIDNSPLRTVMDDSPLRMKRSPRKRNSKRKSQTVLTGRIPLVNTSSEDEGEIDDSFDKKIAASLETARPRSLNTSPARTGFLVRGSTMRSTIRGSSSRLPTGQKKPLPDLETPPRETMSEAISPVLPRSSRQRTPNRDTPLHINESTPSLTLGKSNIGTPAMNMKETAGKQGQADQYSPVERQPPLPDDYDSPSSGVGSITGAGHCSRVDLEEEMSSSIALVRKIAEEKLQAEKRRHQDELSGIERERKLERNNLNLKMEELRSEHGKTKKDFREMKEKVKLLMIEKQSTDEQLMALAEENEKLRDDANERENRSSEEELHIQVAQLSERLSSQDSALANLREDNIVLRSQNRKLKESLSRRDKDNKFRIFGAPKENVSVSDIAFEDPADIRSRLRKLEQELQDQMEVNNQLKSYVGEVLVNIMVSNPDVLEKS